MKFTINPELIKAIEKNEKWIKKKCKFSERNASKCNDLIQDVFLNIYVSSKNFNAKETVNVDAWLKKITTNVTSSYVNEVMIEKKVISENVDNIEASGSSNTEFAFDLQVAINFIKTSMSERDREILFLSFMQEPQASIAEIIGLEVSTVTNIISARKKELNEYLNKGQV